MSPKKGRRTSKGTEQTKSAVSTRVFMSASSAPLQHAREKTRKEETKMAVAQLMNLLKEFDPTAEVKIMYLDDALVEHTDDLKFIDYTKSIEDVDGDFEVDYHITLS